MKSIFRTALIMIAFACIFYSCSRYRLPRSPDAVEDRRTAQEPRYNLMDFPGDDSAITADVPAADDTVREESDLIPFPEYEAESEEIEETFSVQLFASKSSEGAEEFKNEVQSLFEEVVLIDYKAPYYKVRVGETSTLEEGEALLEHVKQMGFKNAWLVRIRY